MMRIYKPIGDYIQLFDERNKGHEIKNLLGLSISKQFIPSVANIIGTDMENYKIIRKNQFACSTMQVRRDKKMPVALLQEVDVAIISQAYPIFEVKDEKLLLPEYLMMWFTRSEFDREACFYAVGGVRGSLEWADFCDMQIPIPTIEKQREVVAEYNVVQNRIDLNNQLIAKLEETAQAIYREWFVDFESDKYVSLKEYIETNPKVELKKGEMAKYIEMANLSETSMCINGVAEREYNGGSRFQNDDTLLARITPCLENGKTAFVNVLDKDEVAAGSTEFIVMRARENVSPFFVFCLAKDEYFRTFAISSMIGSSGRQRVHESYLAEFQLAEVNDESMMRFDSNARPLFEMVKVKSIENQKLSELKELLLSKLATIEN
jgi:type I restriction enzyme S subunit